jgi:predicted HTH transcriptional regulator
MGVCEERGSGIDKVVFQCEIYQLPAPLFESLLNSTRAVLYAYKPFNRMDPYDRMRACYLHACLRYVQADPMTNATLRKRFGIASHNSALASRIIRDSVSGGVIKPYDPDQAKKNARYVPFWA